MKYEKQGKYIFVVDPKHPMAGSRGRILEHRYIMANHIGRVLTKEEVVHHIDEDPTNNSLKNLELMKLGEHTKHHCPKVVVDLVCPLCGKGFQKTKREIRRNKRAFCSRRCSTRFYSFERQENRGKTPGHGVYGYRTGCRCGICRKAKRDEVRKQRKNRRKRPSKDKLVCILSDMGISGTAEVCGVTLNTVRSWCRLYEID